MTTDAANNAELDSLPDGLTRPHDRECLTCYVMRMLDLFACDTQLRWTKRWRDCNAPAAVLLLPSLESRGGYCDCEMLFNVHHLNWPDSDTPQLPCLGVRGGSTQPCRPTRRQDHDDWHDEI